MFILPAGNYIISDPCYVLSDKDYGRALNETEYFGCYSNTHGGVFVDSVYNKKWACFNTKYGDGLYSDNEGREYGVDAGCIACIPVEMICPDFNSSDEKYSHIVKFENDFIVGYDDGMIYYGNVVIDTEGWNDDFDDEVDEDWEYQE